MKLRIDGLDLFCGVIAFSRLATYLNNKDSIKVKHTLTCHAEYCILPLGKLVTEKSVDFVDFDSVVKINKNRQNDDNVVKAYKS